VQKAGAGFETAESGYALGTHAIEPSGSIPTGRRERKNAVADEEAIQERRERRIRIGQTIRVLAALTAVALLAIFAALNTQDVGIDYAFGEVSAPMIIVIVASAAVGFVAGMAVGGRTSRS
jgi:uncharacterized integral membrane protein